MDMTEHLARSMDAVFGASTKPKPRTESHPLDASDDLELTVTYAEYVLQNQWWFRDHEEPDVMILSLTLSAAGGAGDTTVHRAFFPASQIAHWEKLIANDLQLEAGWDV